MRATPSKIGMTPPHPGAFIRDEILDELGLSVSAAAAALGVRRATLSDLINGNAALSPEMALRVEKAFGVNMETLLRMQAWHDAVAMRGQADEIDVKPYSAPDAAARLARQSEGELIEARRLAKTVIEGVLRTENVKNVSTSKIAAVLNQLIESDPSYIEQAKANIAEAETLTASERDLMAALGTSVKPAVPPKKSVTPDYLICLEDGRKFKSLKRHLRTQYGLSPEQYREKWGLPSDYPMVAPAYAKARTALAKQMGLGQQGRMKRGART